MPLRLLNSAEAFYYAGVLCSLKFDSENVAAGAHRNAQLAAAAAVTGEIRGNELGAPPIVNFGFAVELFIKLLCFLAGGELMSGHNLLCLFLKLDQKHPDITKMVIDNHFYCKGDRGEFIEDLEGLANVFEQWRYAHEKPFLCASADSLLTLSDAFRATIDELYPNLRSAFRRGTAL